ncbi:hypothetical protein U3A55_00220 [Salarchaeum sp. III]|uniref:hypothetical protein n=1 Tax=Salarchaeum sp. III TaxID=3107927 RepID=UPI002ED7D2E5
MRIEFEEWLKDRKISTQTKALLDESVLCYRASAHRAALLYSFLAFQTIIKERLLNSQKPNECPEGMWNDMQRKLLEDDNWESQVIEAVKRKQPVEFFLVSEDVRRQYEYWKDRRNDCAHAKGNKISYQHVETFWLYVQSNLEKFAVNGGKESIIERIKVHFDRSKTPKQADFTSLIEAIILTVKKEEIQAFLTEIYDYFDNNTLNKAEDVQDFWITLLQKERADMRQEVVRFLMNKKRYTLDLLRYKPNAVICFREEPQFIRLLWKEQFYNSYRLYPLFISMLRNDLIPKLEKREAIEHVVNIVNDSIFYHLERVDVLTLQESGFFDIFYDIAFGIPKIRDFDWARENRNIIELYIKLYGLNHDMVRVLNSTFNNKFTPWKLGDTIKELFEERYRVKEEYIRLSEENGDELPKKLGFEKEEIDS